MKITVVLYVMCLLIACNSNQESIRFNLLDSVKTSDAFTAEIPRYGLHKFIKKDALALGLDPIEAGYNSFQLRVWLGHSLARARNVVIIKKKKEKWYAQLVTFSKSEEETGDKPAVFKKEIKNLEPSSGWKDFIHKMEEYQIAFLNNSDSIPDYNSCGGADGINYSFELATKDKYRFYEYCNPAEESGKFWQARNVLQFAAILEDEFNFKYTK